MTRFGSVDAMLADARSRLDRLDPRAAAAAARDGAVIVDIRPEWQRAEQGEIAGSVIVERNHLEWRLHPDSEARITLATTDRRWIVVCAEGYTSSLAADALLSLGVAATDVDGGVLAWVAAGLPVVPGPSPVESVVSDAAGSAPPLG